MGNISSNSKGMYKGKSHAEGGIPVVVDGNTNVEIEGNEYHLCRDAMSSAKIYSFKNKSNKEILDSIYSSEGCKFVQGIANSGDFIVCKLVVLDDDKRTISGTVKSIIDTMQSEKSCNVSEGGSKMEKGGGIENEKWVSCPKCGGSGEIELYRNTRGGVCFDCGGKGVVLNYQAKDIKEKMIESRKKYEEKKRISIENQAERDKRLWERRNLIAQELNKKIFELRLKDADINYLVKIEDFSKYVKLAEKHLNVKTGEELIEFLKDYAKEYLTPYYTLYLENYLREKYNYSWYFNNNKEAYNNFFAFTSYHKYNTKGYSEIEQSLKDKYRKMYDKIGRYDDDNIEDRPFKSKFNDGGSIDEHKETYEKWKSLVNMSKSELKEFYNSQEGKDAGLSDKESNDLGISNGRESARWIMRMKDTPVSDWTPKMWEWANKQISFISRMSGNKGSLYDDNGNKTRKHTSLLIWGHNPKKMGRGGEVQGIKDFKNVKIINDYYPKNIIAYVSPKELLDRHLKDEPSYSILIDKNKIGNRVETAKKYLENYLNNPKLINPKTNQRTEYQATFEPSIVSIYNGKFGFTDGRHRVLSAYLLGLEYVPISIPKNQIDLFRDNFSSFIVSGENGNPKKMGNGGEIKDLILSKKIELNFYRTLPDHALEYGIKAKNPLYLKNFHVTKSERLKGIGKKMLKYLDDYAIENGNDVIFGHINQKATFTKNNQETYLNDTQLIKNWLHDNGYAVNDDDNNFHKVVSAKMKQGGNVITYRNKFNKKYGFELNESHSLEEIAKLTSLKLSALQDIYNKGIGAYKTNPESVRPIVKSKEQWAMARVYSAVMGGKASKVDANELERGKKYADGGSVKNDKWIEEGYYNKHTGVKIDELVEYMITLPKKYKNISVWVHNEIHYKDLFINSKILDSIIGKPYLLEIDISRWQGHLGNSYQIEVAEFNLKGNDDYLTAEKKINYLNDIQYQRIKDIYNFKYSNSEWRFPTKIEMEAIYRNKDEIIGRIDSEQSNRYWIKKNTMNDGYTSVFDMEDGSVQEQGMKTSYFKLRLVRNFDTHTQSLYTPTKIIKSNILKDGGSVDNLFELVTYQVTIDTNSTSDEEYIGFDEEKAISVFNGLGANDLPTGSINYGGFCSLYKKVDKYKFVYELDKEYNEEISDYPIEEYYDDKKYYKLVKEGENDIIEHRDIAGANDESNNLLEEITNYYHDEYGKFKYNLINVYADNDIEQDEPIGCIQLRIADHTENINNVDRFGRCDFYISVVVADNDVTRNRFGMSNSFDRRSNEVEILVKSRDTFDDAIDRIQEEIINAIEYVKLNSDDNTMAKGGNIPHSNMELLAPNGNKSNLNHEQWHLVRTPAFKQWFGDWEKLAMAKIKDSAMDEVTLANISKDVSKVVDENGEPLVVYHGTQNDFKKNKDEVIFDTKYDGAHFGTLESTYNFYPTTTYPVFLNVKNLKNGLDQEIFVNKIIEEIKKEYGTEFLTAKMLKEVQNRMPLYREQLKPNFDGIRYLNIIEGNKNSFSYVVFEPNQIKLADGTNTTFDGNNDDIRYEDGGGIEFVPEKKGTLIKGNEIIKYFEKVNGNYRLIFYTLNETKGKVPTMCHSFGYCEELDSENVTPKELVELIKKNNLMEKGGEVEDLDLTSFDWDSVYNPSDEEKQRIDQEIKESQKKEKEDWYQKSGFKRYSETYEGAINKAVKSYLDAKEMYEDWSTRQYKSNKGIVYAGGDDIHGDVYTIGGINENRKRNRIMGAKMQMDESIEILKDLGLSDEEISNLTQTNKMADSGEIQFKEGGSIDESDLLKSYGIGETFSTKEFGLKHNISTALAYKKLCALEDMDLVFKYGYKTRNGWDDVDNSNLKPNSLHWQIPLSNSDMDDEDEIEYNDGGEIESHENLESQIMKQQFGK